LRVESVQGDEQDGPLHLPRLPLRMFASDSNRSNAYVRTLERIISMIRFRVPFSKRIIAPSLFP
jgi:hypothetical protein